MPDVIELPTTVESADASERSTSLLGSIAGAAPGALLGAVFGAAALVRRTKPLHPQGRVGAATLEITEPQPDLGVPLLASRGTHRCTARWSRAMGLPSPLPDFEGLAIRLEEPTTADLLFASTGTGAFSRFLLVPRPAGKHGPQTTLLPVSSAAGASLVFRVTPAPGTDPGQEPPRRFELAVATSGSVWKPAGVLDVTWGPDRPMRFDPVENLLPGTEQYPIVRTLREPAYFMARRGSAART